MARLCKDGYLIQSLRNSDFDCFSAYGEVIDNSLQADAKNISIEFDCASRGTGKNQKEVISKITFIDDGKGMDPDILENCLTLGYSSRYNDRTGIGRFGVGATLAALHECTNIEVFSKSKNSDWHYVSVEVALTKEGNPDPENQKEISTRIKQNLPSDLKSFSNKESGTIVIWSNHDRNELKCSEVVEETKVWVGRTYRKFIWKGVQIQINGEEVKAIDPLYVTTEKTKFEGDPSAYEYQSINISWPLPETGFDASNEDKTISIRTSLLPKQFRYKKFLGGGKEAKMRYIDRNEGISILRNDREVFFGIPPNWPRGGVKFTDNTDKNRWWGCEISFNAIHDTSFTVKNIKRGAQPVLELRRAINDKIKGIVKKALEIVDDDWAKHEQEEKDSQLESETHTGHEEAENVAKNTPTEANQLTKGKDKNDLIKEASDKLLTDKQKQLRAEWEAKFEAQPFTIFDGDWRGTEFVQINHTATGAVLKYNIRHKFHQEIIKLQGVIEDSNDQEETKAAAKKLKALIDLLLISYCKSELTFDNSQKMSPEELVEDLRINWGRFLERYIKKLNEG